MPQLEQLAHVAGDRVVEGDAGAGEARDEVAGVGVAEGGEAGVHLGGGDAGVGAQLGIGGPEAPVRVLVGQVLGDGERVGDAEGLLVCRGHIEHGQDPQLGRRREGRDGVVVVLHPVGDLEVLEYELCADTPA